MTCYCVILFACGIACRTAWLAAPGVTGPTTLLPLCEHSRMSLVCKRRSDSGTRLGSRQMAAPRTLPDVARRSWSTEEFPCLPLGQSSALYFIWLVCFKDISSEHLYIICLYPRFEFEERPRQPWAILHPRSPESSRAIWALPQAWSSRMCPTDWRRFPKFPLLGGDKSWLTWPSARCPRTSQRELLLQRETSDSRCSPRPTQRPRKLSLQRNLPTDVWPWWRSLECSSRRR